MQTKIDNSIKLCLKCGYIQGESFEEVFLCWLNLGKLVELIGCQLATLCSLQAWRMWGKTTHFVHWLSLYSYSEPMCTILSLWLIESKIFIPTLLCTLWCVGDRPFDYENLKTGCFYPVYFHGQVIKYLILDLIPFLGIGNQFVVSWCRLTGK